MSSRDLTALVAIVVAASTAACVSHAGGAGGQMRGVGAGWESNPSVRSPALTARGTSVRIVAEPGPGCTHAGYVTGVARRLKPRPVGLSRPEWELTLPWSEAESDARNLAGAHGAAVLVIDGRETQERRSEYQGNLSFTTYVLVHARAFTCKSGAT